MMTHLIPKIDSQIAPLLIGARLDHISMIVHDREKTINHLAALIPGPFQRCEYENQAVVYGKRSRYTLCMALAPLTPNLDIEIIQLKSGRNEVHERFLRDHGEGIQHVAYEVDNFESSVAAFRSAGFKPILEKDGGTPVAIYMDTSTIGGIFIELVRKGFKLTDPTTWPR